MSKNVTNNFPVFHVHVVDIVVLQTQGHAVIQNTLLYSYYNS